MAIQSVQIGDYDYSLDTVFYTASVRVADTSKSSYGKPLGKVTWLGHSYIVDSMRSCFSDCYNMTSPPDLSDMDSVGDMSYCFYGCEALTIPPSFSGLMPADMSYCFYGCESLQLPPDIGDMIELVDMERCFYGCISLCGFLDVANIPNDVFYSSDIFGNMSASGSVSSPLYLIVSASNRQSWIDYSKPSRVQVLPANASDITVTMTPYKYTYSTDSDGKFTALSCKVNDFSLTSYPRIYKYKEVTSLKECFYGCTKLVVPPDLSGMTSVTDMSSCFSRCISLATPPDLSGMTAVTDMSYCFKYCSNLATPPDFSGMTAVTNMCNCFEYCYDLTTPPVFSGMSSVTNMAYCFANCTSLATPPDLSGMSAVTNMEECFYYCNGLTSPPDLSGMTAVTNMTSCFEYCTSLATPPDLSDMISVTKMYRCFYACRALTIPPDLSGMTAVTDMSYCFNGCNRLRSFLVIGTATAPSSLGSNIFGSSSQVNEEDLYLIVPSAQRSNWTSYAKPSKVKVINAPASSGVVQYYYGYSKIVYTYIYSTDSSGQLTELRCLCYYVPISTSSEEGKEPILESFPPLDRNTTSLSTCFDKDRLGGDSYTVVSSEGNSATKYYKDLINEYDYVGDLLFPEIPESVTTMQACFWGCLGLTVPPEIPESVTTMQECFWGCLGLTVPPDISRLSNLTKLSSCFYGCANLKDPPDLSHAYNVTDIVNCFHGCSSLSSCPDLSAMTSVTDLSGVFYGCSGLSSCPDLSAMTSVTDLTWTFCGCSGFTEFPDVSSLTSVTVMDGCFYGCTGVFDPPDISMLTALTDISKCFSGCTSLASFPDLSSLTELTEVNHAFENCTSISGDLNVSSRKLIYGGYTTQNSSIFKGTVNEIWIVPNEDVTDDYRTVSDSDMKTSGNAWWRKVYTCHLGPSDDWCQDNVHFYSPNLNPDPIVPSLTCRRLEGLGGYFLEASTGTMIMVKIPKPSTTMQYVRRMPTIKKISIWAGTPDDLDYMQNTLSIDEDVGFAKIRDVLYDQNPSDLGYYEKDQDDEYVRTEDESPVDGKDYYFSIDGEALSRGLVYTKILYRLNPDAPEDADNQRMEDFSLYTKGVYSDLQIDPTELGFEYFYTFMERDVTTNVIAVLVEDSLGNVGRVIATVPKAFATFSFLKPGAGVAVGIPARRSGLDVDMQSYFEENLVVHDVPTLPVVMTYGDPSDENAHYPDPCLVLQVDPKYLWRKLNGMTTSLGGVKLYLRGSSVQTVPQRAGRAFVTATPGAIMSLGAGGGGSVRRFDSWVGVDTVISSSGVRVDSFFPVSGTEISSDVDAFRPVFSRSATAYTSDGTKYKYLNVSVVGCDSVLVEFRNGMDDNRAAVVSFVLHGIDEEYGELGDGVADSKIVDSYLFEGLEGKPHTFLVENVVDNLVSDLLDETELSLSYVRIVPNGSNRIALTEEGE